LSNTTNGVVSVSYGASADWTLYDPLAESVVLFLWVDTSQNTSGFSYSDDWNSASLILVWDGSAHIGTIDLNTHSFNGTIIPTGTTVTNFRLILRNPSGSRQSLDLLASDYGYLESTLPVEEFSKNLISINLIENNLEIEGLEYNQKFELKVYDLNGRLVKKMNEKSSLNLNELVQSVYILKLEIADNLTVTKKVIKK